MVNIMALFSFNFSPYHHHRYFAFTFFFVMTLFMIILVSINSILNLYNFHFFTSIHFIVNYLHNYLFIIYFNH